MPSSRVNLRRAKAIVARAVALCFLRARIRFCRRETFDDAQSRADEDQELLENWGMQPLEPHAV